MLPASSPMLPVSPPVRSETPPVFPPVRPEIPVSFPLPVIPLKSPPLLSPSVMFLSPSLLPVRSEKLLVSPPVKSLIPPVLPPVSSEAPCVFAGPGFWLPAEAANQLIRFCFNLERRRANTRYIPPVSPANPLPAEVPFSPALLDCAVALSGPPTEELILVLGSAMCTPGVRAQAACRNAPLIDFDDYPAGLCTTCVTILNRHRSFATASSKARVPGFGAYLRCMPFCLALSCPSRMDRP